MKYDLTQKLSRGAVRTINAFTGSMFSLLSEKSFESVSVNEICLRSGYPRATFYNYFDDKYDLLTCCWIKLAQTIGFDEFKALSDKGEKREALYLFADRVYDLGSANLPLVQIALIPNIGRKVFAPMFQAIGMHCMGCAMASGENVEEACAAHGVDVDKFVEKVNEFIAAQG